MEDLPQISLVIRCYCTKFLFCLAKNSAIVSQTKQKLSQSSEHASVACSELFEQPAIPCNHMFFYYDFEFLLSLWCFWSLLLLERRVNFMLT